MKYSFLIVATLALCSCGGVSPEEEGARMLSEARAALQAKDYNAARDTIMSLRKRFPTAIEARKQGILLLDSVELFAAEDSLAKADSAEWERLDVKAKFFRRKLQEDVKR